jgi:RNA polymerase sigma factor (sigma-70 family)
MEAKVIYMTDENLLEGCRRNDRSSQRQFYERHFNQMSWLCYRYVKDKDIADDIVHEGFIKVFKKIQSFEGKGSFEGWMKRIMVNCCLDYLRKNKRVLDALPLSEVSEQSYDEEILAGLQADYILEKIQDLPRLQQTVFNLFVIEGYPHKEIADMLNIKASTSRAYLTEARQMLRKLLEQTYQNTERRVQNG